MNCYQLALNVSNTSEKDYSSFPVTEAISKGMAILKVLACVREQRPNAVITVKQIYQVEKPEKMFITVK